MSVERRINVEYPSTEHRLTFQEYHFLRHEKKKFERMLLGLEKQIKIIEETKAKIASDIFKKERAINVEEGCAKVTANSQCKTPCGRRLKKKK